MLLPRAAGSRSLRLLGHHPHRPHSHSQWHSFHTTAANWRKVMQKFKLADIGEGITECEIIKWNIKPPTQVSSFDPLCEVQSDKATVEITSPFDGVLKEILVEEGGVAKVGEGLCLIEVEEEGEDGALAEPEAGAEAGKGALADVGAGETGRDGEKAARPPPHPAQAEAEEKDAKATEEKAVQRRPHPLDPNQPTPSPLSSTTNTDAKANVLATPSVRHFARSRGMLDLGKLMPGSGRDGRIERADVEKYLASASSAASALPQGKAQGDVIVELGRTRYGMWKAMTKSLEIPHFGYTTSLDITALSSLLPILNANIPTRYLPSSSSQPSPASTKTQAVSPSSFYAEAQGEEEVLQTARYTRLTYLPILLKTLSKAMMEWPLFRSSLTPTSPSSSSAPRPTLTLRPTTDISLALSTPTGLYTPLLPAVSSLSTYQIASHLTHLSNLGRQVPCGLTLKEMPKRGGTITVSNIGAIGKGESAFPRLVDGGGVGIVALGRARWERESDFSRSVSEKSEGEKRTQRLFLPVSWSADHRIVEGAELAAFVETWRGWVEKPERLIGEGV